MSWQPVFSLAPPTPTSTEQTAQTLIGLMLNAKRITDIDMLTKNTPVTQVQLLNEVNNNITNFATAPANVIINEHYIKSPAFLKNNYALNAATMAANEAAVSKTLAKFPSTVPAPNVNSMTFDKAMFTRSGFAALPMLHKILLVLAIIILLGGISAGIFFMLKKPTV